MAQWSGDEDDVVDRYARAVIAGRYENASQAAADCQSEIAARSPGSRRRTQRAIATRICRKAARLGQPRPYVDWTTEEEAIIDRFAQDLVAGRFGCVAEAVGPCLLALHSQGVELGRPKGLSPEKVARRSAPAVKGKLHIRAREMGRSWPSNRRWSTEEKQLLNQWVKWYAKYRGVHRLRPLTEAAIGLQDDLAKIGSVRTFGTCKGRLGEERRRAEFGGRSK